MPDVNGVAKHPAEAGGLAGAVVVVIAHFAGLTDPSTLVALTVIVGALPAAITWAVSLVRNRQPPTSPAP